MNDGILAKMGLKDVLTKIGLKEKPGTKFYCPQHGKQETSFIIDGKFTCVLCGLKLEVKMKGE